jgi:hypothetical protein
VKANLQMTRLKDMEKGEVLVFKEMSWQTVRIEAKSTVSEELTPLRFRNILFILYRKSR